MDSNNLEWLIAILGRFQDEGKYYKDEETFSKKVDFIRKFHETIKIKKLNNENNEESSVKNFFEKILYGEVTKPTISLYLSSLIKAKELRDSNEYQGWSKEVLEKLNPFIIPTYLQDSFRWILE